MTALSYRTNYKLQACEGQEPFFPIYINTILKHPCVHLKALLNAPSQYDSSVSDLRQNSQTSSGKVQLKQI